MDDWTMANVSPIRFAHPRNWEVEVDRSEEGVSIYLQSDAVSFGVVGVYPAEEEPEDILEQILESVREEHPGLEVDPVEVQDDAYPEAIAAEGLFMTLDTVAYCWVRSWRLPDHRAIVVYVQSVEKESADSEEIFHGICKSITPERDAR